MEITVKHFNELSTDELWKIYELRCAVFVVEQNCAYQDVDKWDCDSYHIMLTDSDNLIGYSRVLPAGTVFDTVSIGRVIAKERRKGYGTLIVNESIKTAEEKFGADIITIEAQCYARSLYEKAGFVQTSEEFLEDGIPHIQMKYYF